MWCTIFAIVVIKLVLLKVYIKFTTGWSKSQTCLVGKTVIVTGSNTGIGYETALDFAKRGARVILACRDEKRANEARDKIIEATGNKNVIVKLIQMDSFSSVRAFAKDILESESRLDILVNNAGAFGVPGEKSKDGHVLLMQVNYLAPFLLTILLIDLLKKTKQSRIVNVSSLGAKHARHFDVKKLDVLPSPSPTQLYMNTKLCNVLFTIELARRLFDSEVTTYSLHPGCVKTEILRHGSGFWKIPINIIMNLYFKTCEEGAQTSIYCSVTKGIESENGEHFADCQKVARYQSARIPGLAKELWDVTTEILDLKGNEIKI